MRTADGSLLREAMKQATGASAIPSVAAPLLAAALLMAGLPGPSHAEDGAVDRGRYLVHAGGCISCHTDKKGKGAPLAGGRGLKTPFGIYYSSNITPDRETGIGAWTDADFVRALKRGLSPEGEHYFPVFPYTTYTKIREADVRAIKAYLFSLEPVSRKNRDHDVSPPFGWRWTIGPWKQLCFDEGELKPDPTRDQLWNRGAYLVGALAHCGECHSPRNFAGALDRSLLMAGTKEGPEGERAPNITPDSNTGIGDWSEEQTIFFLKKGTKPDWEEAEGAMAETIDDGLSHLSDEDLKAIARYMNTLPAIENRIGN